MLTKKCVGEPINNCFETHCKIACLIHRRREGVRLRPLALSATSIALFLPKHCLGVWSATIVFRFVQARIRLAHRSARARGRFCGPRGKKLGRGSINCNDKIKHTHTFCACLLSLAQTTWTFSTGSPPGSAVPEQALSDVCESLDPRGCFDRDW